MILWLYVMEGLQVVRYLSIENARIKSGMSIVWIVDFFGEEIEVCHRLIVSNFSISCTNVGCRNDVLCNCRLVTVRKLA